jgi:hypothetical protein
MLGGAASALAGIDASRCNKKTESGKATHQQSNQSETSVHIEHESMHQGG